MHFPLDRRAFSWLFALSPLCFLSSPLFTRATCVLPYDALFLASHVCFLTNFFFSVVGRISNPTLHMYILPQFVYLYIASHAFSTLNHNIRFDNKAWVVPFKP